ncbi:Uncharacterized protein TCM_017485 [Theobroma cacao]|uniref:Retrotransposon gag domain-containing protein n=1 Tax=Theobroma cacao TaxID=3641 RepID=A0A061EDR2_THECC|nr:Uncharacterized protein TCM_017485 [Theobroma cacao]
MGCASKEEAAGRGAEHRPLGEPALTAPGRQPAQPRQIVYVRPSPACAPNAQAACPYGAQHFSPPTVAISPPEQPNSAQILDAGEGAVCLPTKYPVLGACCLCYVRAYEADLGSEAKLRASPRSHGLGRLQNPHVTGGIRPSAASQAVCWDSGRDRQCCWVCCKPSSVVGGQFVSSVPTVCKLHQSRKGKSCSRDLISSLDARLSRVKLTVGDMRDRLDVQEEHLEELNGLDEELKGKVHEMVREMLENVAEQNSQLESMVEILQHELEDLRAEVRAARAEGGYEVAARSEVRLEVPKPKELRCKRDAKEIDNFLWGLEQYFKVTGISTDDHQMTAASMYLGDTALLWWRHRCDDRLGGAPVLTWVDFQTELRKQLYPKYAMDEARGKLLAEGLIDYSRLDKDRTESAKPKDKGKGWEDKGKQSRVGSSTQRWQASQGAHVCRHGDGRSASGGLGGHEEQAAAKLGIKVDSTESWVKTVNSKWVLTKGIVKVIDVQLGEWHGTEDIEVIQMDDYEVVMRLYFLEQIQALLVPYNDCICILAKGEQICAAVLSLEDTPDSIVEALDEVLEVSEHELGGANPVTRESSKEATPSASSKVRAELLPHIKEGQAHYPTVQLVRENAKSGEARRIQVSDRLG